MTAPRLSLPSLTLALAASTGCADTSNPPVVQEPAWDTPRTRALAERACFDCHSNQTKWPWYASVPLIGLWIEAHVVEGRSKLNFSTWTSPQREVSEIGEVLTEGEMPPAPYVLAHAEATLTAEENAALLAGLAATIRRDPPPGAYAGDPADDDRD